MSLVLRTTPWGNRSLQTKPSLVVFVGGMGGSPVEDMIGAAHRAITVDTVERAASTGLFDRIVVATDYPELAEQLDSKVIVEVDNPPFHFGQRLREIILKYEMAKPFYVGGGAGPLLSAQDWAALAEQISSSEDTFITNNLFSTDFIAFSPGLAINKIQLPKLDNPLAQSLRKEAGLREQSLPRNAATQFDVDTPSDLMVLKVHPTAGRHALAYLDGLDLDVSRVRRAMHFFIEPMSEVVLAGRVGSYAWSHLETETACRVRVLSEERGMRADGREERGEVRSLLGFYIQEVGVYKFFQRMGELGAAAFIDSRVIFNHMGLKPTASDRFLSDLNRPEGIKDPFVRDFTLAAMEAPIPVVLGGHSLVAGGIWALVDAAWLDNDTKLDSERLNGITSTFRVV